MKTKTLLAALVLMTAPLAAQAQCAWEHSTQEASMSCAEGTSWDATTMACVPTASS